jgi:hypothetical protein
MRLSNRQLLAVLACSSLRTLAVGLGVLVGQRQRDDEVAELRARVQRLEAGRR